MHLIILDVLFNEEFSCIGFVKQEHVKKCHPARAEDLFGYVPDDFSDE